MGNCVDEYIASLIEEGRQAYLSNIDYSDYPYDYGTPEHEYWVIGWKRGCEDNRAAPSVSKENARALETFAGQLRAVSEQLDRLAETYEEVGNSYMKMLDEDENSMSGAKLTAEGDDE